jgi:peroxiredoxin
VGPGDAACPEERENTMLKSGDRIGDVTLLDAEGQGRTLHLVFIRHLACIACQAHLNNLKNRYAEFQNRQCEIIAVSMSLPKSLKVYGQRVTWPFPIYGDPEKQAYRALDLNPGSLWRILKPLSMLNYLQLMLRGWLIRPPYEGESITQMGGNFTIDPQGNILFAHRCADPADRPSLRRILASLPATSPSRVA